MIIIKFSRTTRSIISLLGVLLGSYNLIKGLHMLSVGDFSLGAGLWTVLIVSSALMISFGLVLGGDWALEKIKRMITFEEIKD